MKNRVLRSALAVIIVIAMVLTMAACNSSSDDVVTTTTTPVATATPAAATETPVAPTEAPVVTTAPTVAPTTAPVIDTVADDFGISLVAVDGTYDTKAKDVDGDSISGVYGYFLLTVDEDYYDDEQYDVKISYDGSVIYDSTGGTVVSSITPDYDGDHDTDPTLALTAIDDDIIYIKASSAGTYEIELDIEIVDRYNDYGAWDNDDKEDYETTLTSVLTIAKSEITVNVDSVVVEEDEDEELSIDAATGVVYVGSTGYAAFPTLSSTDIDEDLTGYSLVYSLDYTEEAAVGTYAVTMTIEDASGDEIDLDDLNDLLPDQIVTEITTAQIYVVSNYDWNEIRDVVTSIAEIDYDATGLFYGDDSNIDTQAVLALARYNALSAEQQAFFENGDVTQLGANIVGDNVATWSVVNEAVADEDDYANVFINLVKQTYGTTNIYNYGAANVAIAYVNALLEDANVTAYGPITELDSFTGLYAANFDAADLQVYNAAMAATYAEYFLEFLEDAEEAAEEKVIVDAFKDIVDDADLADYITYTAANGVEDDDDEYGSLLTDAGYYTSNSSAITAFNTVDAYWNSLSEDDQEIIQEYLNSNYDSSDEDTYDVLSATEYYTTYDTDSASVTASAYEQYLIAEAAFNAAEVTAVQELIVGAYNAYVKAVNNGAKVIYQDSNETGVFTEWAYINSSEVISLTAQAQAAYDALTSSQKSLLKVADDEGLIVAPSDSSTIAYEIVEFVLTGDDKATFVKVLTQLSDMNEMVETMIAIANYVNIEDYSTDALVYGRLNALVYGTVGLYFPEYTEDDGDYRYAMEDIISAASRNYDAIIAEYQAWIDYILYLEDYKADLVDAFKAGVADAIAELDTDDYDAATLSKASSMSNAFAKAIIAAIEDETATVVGGGSASYELTDVFSGTTAITITSGPIIELGFLSDYDSIEEIMEDLEDYCDIEDVIDAYIDSIIE